MKPSLLRLAIKAKIPVHSAPYYEIPSLTSISAKDLVNESFGKGTYYLSKSKFGHWPVYKKVQNTKISTEIKRVQGDVLQFKKDLIKVANLNQRDVTANQTAGYVNVKGDKVESIKAVFDKYFNEN